MKYALRDIKAEALNFNINRIKVEKDTRIEIRPKFARTVRRVQENDKLWFLVLEVKVETSDAEPTPFTHGLGALPSVKARQASEVGYGRGA